MRGGPSPGAPAGTELEWVWQQLAKGREPNLAEPGQSWLAGDAQAGVRAGGPLAVVLRRKQRLSAGGRRVSLGSRTREGLGPRYMVSISDVLTHL